MKKPYILLVTVIIFLISIFTLSSCSSHSESMSFLSGLDEIDTFISNGDTKEAISLLKPLTKKAYSAYARLGIYKRYMILGESQIAEKVLLKALKKLPDNQEILFIYTNFLLDENRIKEALKISRKLSGSKYGSIYAEAFFKAAQEFGIDFCFEHIGINHKNQVLNTTSSDGLKKQFYRSDEILYVYKDAGSVIGQTQWLRNVAALYMQKGMITEAVLVAPQNMNGVEDCLFWGSVYFDAGRYVESLDSLLQTNIDNLSFDNNDFVLLEILSLIADNYYILGDDENSHKAQNNFLDKIVPYFDDTIEHPYNYFEKKSISEELKLIITSVYLNNAIYFGNHGDQISEYNTVLRLLNLFPESEQGLSLYGKISLDCINRPNENELVMELRNSGLRTIGMEKADLLPNVSISDVTTKIDSALIRQKSASLIVLKEQLLDYEDKQSTTAKRLSHLWKVLEENSIGTDLYPYEIIRYVITKMISYGDIENAILLFRKFITAKYGKNFIAADNPQKLSLWECEFAGWLSAYENKSAESVRLYEYIILSYAERTPVLNGYSGNTAVVDSFINLSILYDFYGKSELALDMLNKASARTADNVIKSEILYRMAILQKRYGDTESAILSLKYAIRLNPNSNKARIFLRKLK